jgi:hypothetical protein
MAQSNTKRIDPDLLGADKDSLVALQVITTYAPSKPELTTAAVVAVSAALTTAQAAEVQAKNAWDAARDNAVAAEWALHNAILGVKDQVRAQFGPDSNELQSLGLKKKSERNAPKPKSSKPAA